MFFCITFVENKVFALLHQSKKEPVAYGLELKRRHVVI